MSRAPGWTGRLLGFALRSWPKDRRRRYGEQILEACQASIVEAGSNGRWSTVRATAGELAALVVEGVKYRVRDRRRGTDGRGGPRLGGFTADLTLAGRRLIRSPGFSGAGVATLTLGIGVAAATLSLVDYVLFRPADYEDPEELVVIWGSVAGSDERIPVAAPDAGLIAERAGTLSEVAFTNRVTDASIAASESDAVEHVRLAAVSEGFFRVLGASAATGRLFGPGDGPDGLMGEGEESPPSIVLSEELWRRAFGGDPQVVGRSVRLNGRPADVVGIVPADFRLELSPEAGIEADVDVWVALRVPLSAFARNDGRRLDQDSDNTGVVVARMGPGNAVFSVQAELERVASDLRIEVPAYGVAGLGLEARPLRKDATIHARGVLLALLAGASGVLVIACLNLVALLLARGLERRREVGIRVALGASRGRVVRQLLAESTLLVAVGTTLGVWVAAVAIRSVQALAPAGYPVAGLRLDGRALGLSIAVGVLCALLCGSLPAWRLGVGGGGRLAGGDGRSVGDGRTESRLRRGLMVMQIALTTLLLGGAGLLQGTVRSLRSVDLGFEPDRALTLSVSLRTPGEYRAPGERAALMREIEEGISALPGVEAVGLVGVLPLGGERWTQPYGLPGQAESQWDAQRADFRVVTSGYFEAVGAAILAGRGLSRSEDLVEGERVVVVDERLARRVVGGEAYERAVGAVIGIPLDGSAVEARIVGVVDHVRHDHLDRDGREAVYVPYRQEASRDVSFVVRTASHLPAEASAGLLADVRQVVRDANPRLPVHGMTTLARYVDDAMAPRRFALFVTGIFAVLALTGASLGLYGVISFEVARRTREMGVRMALGADRERVLRRFLLSGLRLGLAGLALGGALLWVLAPGLDSLLHGRTATDPGTWLGVAAAILALVLAATAAPAFRASRADPAVALQPE